ncbi:MAG: SDR family oxidoreductase [Candidatus Sungbacteria bacterium]|nr:SDR family oxidoreductase [Candidatus Sungbacteria bacterium]
MKTGPGYVAVITGANGGIGRETARLFAEVPGIDLVLVDRPEKGHELLEFTRSLSRLGATHGYSLNNVADAAEVLKKVEYIIDIHGRIDILVNLAGIPPQKFGPFVKTPLDQMWEVIRVNLGGTLNWCYAVLPHMRAQGYGRVINTSSIAGHRGDAGNLAYAASKAGVESITKTLALEIPYNKDELSLDITVNAIAPGATNTPMIKAIPPAFFEKVKARVPFKRYGRPEEIAAAIKWLACDAPQYLNGAIIPVDGGWSAS